MGSFLAKDCKEIAIEYKGENYKIATKVDGEKTVSQLKEDYIKEFDLK